MSDLYLRLLPVTASGPQHTRVLDHALAFTSQEEALAYVHAQRLDPATLELVTVSAELLVKKENVQ